MFIRHSIRTEVQRNDDIKKLADEMTAWTIPDEALDRVHDVARASLNEVKALTEYEDGKASRLLTIIAFLSAVVAAVFTRFATDYAWPGFDKFALSGQWLLPAATYICFVIYVVVVTWAVGSVIGAIRPTFNVPATWTDGGRTGRPTSMLFYRGILDAPAFQWGRTFIDLGSGNAGQLKSYYAKNYVVEAYLVAEKVAIKLAALEPGIKGLRVALAVLLIFLLLFGTTLLSLTPTR